MTEAHPTAVRAKQWCYACKAPTAVEVEAWVADQDTLLLLARVTTWACASCGLGGVVHGDGRA